MKPHYPRKRFGQNFLQDKNIILRIIMSLQLQQDDTVVEIGPGRGALTEELQTRVDNLTVVEIDRDLVAELEQSLDPKVNIINADALEFDFAAVGSKLRIIGNLPYNISTPLLFHCLEAVDKIQDMHFMLQKEVVDRLVAVPNTKRYGRLGVMMQYACQTERLFNVPAEAFYPRPQVMSSIIKLTPHPADMYPQVAMAALSKVVAMAFNQRRKIISNSLKELLSVVDLERVGINPQARPESLGVADFVKLAEII